MSLIFMIFGVGAFVCSLRVWDHIEAAILYSVVSMFMAFLAYCSSKYTRWKTENGIKTTTQKSLQRHIRKKNLP